MRGYDEATYGDRIADVYDELYDPDPALEETTAAVERLAGLAEGGSVLELGAGTGRLALPLADHGLAVTALDSSQAMLDLLAAKPGSNSTTTLLGGMAGPLPDGPWALTFVALNAFFNLTSEAAQRQCLGEVARTLAPKGCFVIEAFVPDGSRERSSVQVREVAVDRVVLFVDRHDPDTQEAWSSLVEITPTGNVLRPCHIRYASPAQLDAMAGDAGLRLTERWQDWAGEAFGLDSPTHVSVYRHA